MSDRTTNILISQSRRNDQSCLVTDVFWAPDSDQLVVGLGFKDRSENLWLDFILNGSAFTPPSGLALIGKPQSEWPSGQMQEHPPVWTVGGKKFLTEAAARKEGFSQFYSSGNEHAKSNDTGGWDVFWPNGVRYHIAFTFESPAWSAYFIESRSSVVDRLVLADVPWGGLFGHITTNT
jgi:hypothetical protein